jgi:glycerol-3-phosphate dehydrogenase (NAD(P)+)
MQTAVLGAGSWGTAIAVLTADNGHPTRLWGRSRDQVALLAGGRENERYLPGRAFPVGLEVTELLSRAVDGADLYVAEKSNELVLVFEDLANSPGGDIVPSAATALPGAESVALLPAYLGRGSVR